MQRLELCEIFFFMWSPESDGKHQWLNTDTNSDSHDSSKQLSTPTRRLHLSSDVIMTVMTSPLK